MDLRIKVKDFEMNSAVEDYLDERMQAVEKHLGSDADLVRAEVELGRAAGHSKHGEHWFAEIQIAQPGADMVRVVAHGETVNAAIDAAKDEILLKLKKDRTRRFSRARKIGAQVKDWLRFGQ